MAGTLESAGGLNGTLSDVEPDTDVGDETRVGEEAVAIEGAVDDAATEPPRSQGFGGEPIYLL